MFHNSCNKRIKELTELNNKQLKINTSLAEQNKHLIHLLQAHCVNVEKSEEMAKDLINEGRDMVLKELQEIYVKPGRELIDLSEDVCNLLIARQEEKKAELRKKQLEKLSKKVTEKCT
jgi:hypothetical protein